MKDVTVKLRLDTREFDASLKRARRQLVRSQVPGWCFSPWMRMFVVGNAVAAPVLVLVELFR